MNISILIQARINSARFPGKVMKLINKKILLLYIIERLSKIWDADLIVVATSDNNTDDPIARLCNQEKIKCFRGSLNDVAKRMLDAAKVGNTDAFVRINGDSPLIDPAIVDRGVNIYKNGKYDLVTNTYPRTFPIGQSVEVIRTKTFAKTYEQMKEKDDFEHVTKYYYDHSNDFRIYNFAAKKNISHIRLSVDIPGDLKHIEKIIHAMDRPHTEYGLNEIIKLQES